jgi:hypothetical protein
VSVELILMAYKRSIASITLLMQLDENHCAVQPLGATMLLSPVPQPLGCDEPTPVEAGPSRG